MYFLRFFFLLRFFFFDNESDIDGSGSGSSGTCAFPFFSGNFVGCVSSVGFGVFVLIGIESIDDIVPSFVLKTLGVYSKVGRLIEIFFESKAGRLIDIFSLSKY